MTITENSIQIMTFSLSDIYLLEMTTIENSNLYLSQPFCGIYLFEMTTTENLVILVNFEILGIHLLEMTTIENHKKIRFLLCLIWCLSKMPENPSKTIPLLNILNNKIRYFSNFTTCYQICFTRTSSLKLICSFHLVVTQCIVM